MKESLQERFESIQHQVNADHGLVHRGRYLTASIKVFVGDLPYMLNIRSGEIHSISRQWPLFATADLIIQATEEAWEALWEPYPRPGWHDLFALTKRGVMRIEGNSHVLFAHLQYLKDVLNAPRRIHAAKEMP